MTKKYLWRGWRPGNASIQYFECYIILLQSSGRTIWLRWFSFFFALQFFNLDFFSLCQFYSLYFDIMPSACIPEYLRSNFIGEGEVVKALVTRSGSTVFKWSLGTFLSIFSISKNCDPSMKWFILLLIFHTLTWVLDELPCSFGSVSGYKEIKIETKLFFDLFRSDNCYYVNYFERLKKWQLSNYETRKPWYNKTSQQ